MSELCPNCWNYVIPNAPACSTCGAVFGPGSEWQPQLDDGSPHPPPLDPAHARQPKVSAEQRDTLHRRTMGKLWRVVFGGFGVLIGLLIVWAAVLRDLRAMEMNRVWPTHYWMDVLGFPLMAATLLAFGCAQWLQVAWVGDDADFDDRLWAHLTPRQRVRKIQRRAATGNFALLMWLVFSVALLSVINVNLMEGVLQESLPLADIAAPAIADFLAAIGVFLVGRTMWRSKDQKVGQQRLNW